MTFHWKSTIELISAKMTKAWSGRSLSKNLMKFIEWWQLSNSGEFSADSAVTLIAIATESFATAAVGNSRPGWRTDCLHFTTAPHVQSRCDKHSQHISKREFILSLHMLNPLKCSGVRQPRLKVFVQCHPGPQPTFLISDIPALWRSAHSWAPECPNVRN